MSFSPPRFVMSPVMSPNPPHVQQPLVSYVQQPDNWRPRLNPGDTYVTLADQGQYLSPDRVIVQQQPVVQYVQGPERIVEVAGPERVIVQQQPVVQYVQGPERIVEVPGPERVIVQQQPVLQYVQGPERIVEVPGPERIKYVQGPERIVEVQGPERVVEVERTVVVESAPVRRSGCGVGLLLEKDAQNRAVVVQVLRGGPADGKVFVGDVIVDIDGFRTERIPEVNQVSYFVGDEGTVITLGILAERNAGAIRWVTLVRQPVEMVGTTVRASSPSRIRDRPWSRIGDTTSADWSYDWSTSTDWKNRIHPIEHVGIGAVLASDIYGALVVSDVVPGGAAAFSKPSDFFAEERLKVNDQILAVDGYDVRGKAPIDVRPLLLGPVGSEVRLMVRRAKYDRPIELVFTRRGRPYSHSDLNPSRVSRFISYDDDYLYRSSPRSSRVISYGSGQHTTSREISYSGQGSYKRPASPLTSSRVISYGPGQHTTSREISYNGPGSYNRPATKYSVGEYDAAETHSLSMSFDSANPQVRKPFSYLRSNR